LTEGAGLTVDKVYPALLEALIREKGFPEVFVTADGVNGDVSASGPKRLDARLAEKYDLLILELGANDGLRGMDLSLMKSNLSATIELAQKNGMRVVLAGMRIPPHQGWEYKKGFERVFPDLAKQYEVALVPFLLKGVVADPLLNLPDGVHPNEKGHRRVAETVYKVLKPFL